MKIITPCDLTEFARRQMWKKNPARLRIVLYSHTVQRANTIANNNLAGRRPNFQLLVPLNIQRSRKREIPFSFIFSNSSACTKLIGFVKPTEYKKATIVQISLDFISVKMQIIFPFLFSFSMQYVFKPQRRCAIYAPLYMLMLR